MAVAVARGRSNADIAADALMSLATVRAHVSHVLTKLGLGDRTEIALWSTTRTAESPTEGGIGRDPSALDEAGSVETSTERRGDQLLNCWMRTYSRCRSYWSRMSSVSWP